MDPALGRGYDDFREFVSPMIALRAELSGAPYRIARVSRGKLVDADGKLCEDFLSGWGTQAFGHRNAFVEAAIRRFLDSDAPAYFPSMVSPFAGKLGRALCERTGMHYSSAFFASGGTEVVEAAIKLGRAATGRPAILCLQGAYHGCALGSTAMMPDGPFRDAFGPHVPAVHRLPCHDIDALHHAMRAGDVAAVIVEPVQVEGGIRPLLPGYIDALCALTAEHGALLVADEIQTGLGRTGRMLASETWPRRPDVVLLGKSLGGGALPISCLLTTREIAGRAYGSHRTAESHTSTFSGNAMACVAALAALELLTDELLARVRHKGQALLAALEHALCHLPLVTAVRGQGLLAGIELRDADHPWLSFDYVGIAELRDEPAVGLFLCHRLARAGFLTNVCGHDWRTVRVQPALTIEDERLDAFVAACRDAIEYLCQLG